LTGYLALLAIGVWFFAHPSLRRAFRCALVGVGAVLMASWVWVPLITDSKWSVPSQYYEGSFWLNSYGAPKVLGWLLSGQLFDSGRLPFVSLLVGAGLLVSLFRFLRDERARALVGILTLSLLLFFGRPTLGPLLKVLPGSDDLLLHRYIMGVHLAGIFLAGMGGAWLAKQAILLGSRLMPGLGRHLAIAAVAIVAVVGLAPAWQQVSAYDQRDNELIPMQQRSDQADGAAVAALLARVKTLPAGRVYAGSPSNWGQKYSIGSVPMHAVLLNQGMDGFGFNLRTPSLLADSEVGFDETNPAQYDLFNVRYLILSADRVPAVPATVVALAGRHRLWQVETSGYMDVVDTIGPPIVADRSNVGRRVAGFLRSAELSRKQFPIMSYGGQTASAPTLPAGLSAEGRAGAVIAQSSSPADGIFRAQVIATRPAAVLLKTTYDPRWRVTLDGTDVRPQMVAPGMLAQTVTPGPHSLVFHYVPYPFYPLLLGLGLLTVAALHFGWRGRQMPLSLIALKRMPAVPWSLPAVPLRLPAFPISRILATVTIVFVSSWAIHSLIFTGSTVLNGPYSALLHKSPPATQSAYADPFAQTLLKIDQRIPARASVFVYWGVPIYWGGVNYGYFWSTFWLYPRKVTVSEYPPYGLGPPADVVVQVRSPEQQPLAPKGYTVLSEDRFPNLTVTTYRLSR
jgi:hypothetical protein